MLTIAVNPYHLTSRELPAMASLLIGDRVVTALPIPQAGDTPEAVRRAMNVCPRYMRLLESWRWSGVLWRSGVATSIHAGTDAMADVYSQLRSMAADPACHALRDYLHDDLLTKPDELLDRLSSDLLKGGPDPGFCVPVAGAIDRFAARHGLLVARAGRTNTSGNSAAASHGGTVSLVQRAEEMLGTTVFSAAIPVLGSASARTLEDFRLDLAPELDALRLAIRSAADQAGNAGGLGMPSTPGAPQAARQQQELVRAAAGVYARAFADIVGGVLDRDDDRGTRVTATTCRMVLRALPEDAVVRASIAALRTARRVGLIDESVPSGRSDGERPARRTVMTLVMSEMPKVT